MTRTPRFTSITRALTMIGALAIATPAIATPIDIAGSTTGCFGTGCSVSSSATNATFGLTFTGVGLFDITTDASGSATNILLGTLTRGNTNVSSSTPALPFLFSINFSLPGVTTFTPTAGSINGTSSGGGGALNVNLDNAWTSIAFSGGSFDFRLALDPQVNKNGSANIYGEVRNAALNAPVGDVPTTPVPEPASLLLFGSGLAAVAGGLRRRRS